MSLICVSKIVRLLDVLFPEEEDEEEETGGAPIVSLVFEFVESNLRLVIADTKRPFSEDIVRFYFSQIFCGVAYLHHLGIMHRVGWDASSLPSDPFIPTSILS